MKRITEHLRIVDKLVGVYNAMIEFFPEKKKIHFRMWKVLHHSCHVKTVKKRISNEHYIQTIKKIYR